MITRGRSRPTTRNKNQILCSYTTPIYYPGPSHSTDLSEHFFSRSRHYQLCTPGVAKTTKSPSNKIHTDVSYRRTFFSFLRLGIRQTGQQDYGSCPSPAQLIIRPARSHVRPTKAHIDAGASIHLASALECHSITIGENRSSWTPSTKHRGAQTKAIRESVTYYTFPCFVFFFNSRGRYLKRG